MSLKERIMDPLTLGLIAFFGGSLITGGTIWGIQSSQRNKEDTADVITAIGQLETKFEQSQATAVINLTEPDLLKVPCSSEYIVGTFDKDGKQLSPANGDGLCREMFCRMNRQGGGQNSGGGAGATAQDCSAITDANLSILIAQTCLPYWGENAGGDQNSQYQQCLQIFKEKK